MLNSSLPQNTHPLLMKSLLFLLKPSKFWCEIQVCFSWCHILVIFWSSINYQFFGVFLIIRICQFCPNLHDLVLTPLIFFGPRKPIRLVRVQFGCLPPSLPMSSWGTWVQQVGRSRRNYSEYMVKMDLINRFLSTSNPDISRPHIWLVVWNMAFIFHFMYGMSSETHRLSLHHFSGWLKPTTNQIVIYIRIYNML